MNKLLYTLIIILFLSNSLVAQVRNSKLKGMYVHTVYFADKSNNSSKIYTQDTLFVMGSNVLEPIKKVSDTEVFGQQSRKFVLTGYNIIDFRNSTYASIENIKSKTKFKFIPFQTKVIGFDINFKYYDGEQFEESKIHLDGLSLKKIVYFPKSGQMKGQKVTVYFRKALTASEPSFAPNLESKFGGRIHQIELETPSGTEKIIRKLTFKQLKENPALAFLNSLDH